MDKNCHVKVNEFPLGVFDEMFLEMIDLFLFIIRAFFHKKMKRLFLVVAAIEYS